MNTLTAKEKEFVALGASIASNCVPCIVYHIEKSKKAGISVELIREVIEFAKTIKEVPAKLVYSTALTRLDPENSKKCEFDKSTLPCCNEC